MVQGAGTCSSCEAFDLIKLVGYSPGSLFRRSLALELMGIVLLLLAAYRDCSWCLLFLRTLYRGKKQWFVKWKGYAASQNTWEPRSSFFLGQMLDEFEAKRNGESKSVDDRADGTAERPIIIE
jgi:hypothetical protein